MVTEQISRPAFSGAYPVAEASLYIRAVMRDLDPGQTIHRDALDSINSRHLHYWARQGLAGQYLRGLRGSDVTLNFLDLISLRLIAAMRSHGVSSQDIKTAHEVLQAKWRVSHPFAMQEIWVSGGDVFVREGLDYLAVSKHWQPAFAFIERFLIRLHGITFSEDRVAQQWEPYPNVLLDPSVQFGDPCVKGTRVATEVIWSFHSAGDSVGELARMYHLTQPQIEAAIEWERKLITARN